MKIHCVWEHNGNDSILYAANFVGAYTRGESKEIALQKMAKEIASYQEWKEKEGKMLRRFIWHDRIHAKAMYRMAVRTFGSGIPNIFHFV